MMILDSGLLFWGHPVCVQVNWNYLRSSQSWPKLLYCMAVLSVAHILTILWTQW